MNRVFTLLVLFQLKHFLADYLLQGQYMMGKFKEKGWALPLASHALVHASFTLIIVFAFERGDLYWLAPVDFVAHFCMDRIKASPNLLGRFKVVGYDDMKMISDAGFETTYSRDKKRGNRLFWISLGLDQMVHHLTHYAIIYWIMFL